MFLGCNYSKELIQLLDKGSVDADYIKIGLYDKFKEESKISKALRPVLLHGVGEEIFEHAGMKSLNGLDWNKINRAIKEYKSPSIGYHLAAFKEDFEEDADEEAVIERMVTNTKMWSSKIAVPFLVENVPYYPDKGTLRCTTNPNIINEVCERADVDFLLDIAHAKVAAWHRRENVYSYILKLPLDRVKEIHVAGTLMDYDYGLKDKHFEMQEEDYELLKWILKITKPRIITLVYGGLDKHYEGKSDINALERQLINLKQICKKH
jgi:uncharacterized protein (UPF0276 family)